MTLALCAGVVLAVSAHGQVTSNMVNEVMALSTAPFVTNMSCNLPLNADSNCTLVYVNATNLLQPKPWRVVASGIRLTNAVVAGYGIDQNYWRVYATN